ncbi:MAG: hypothetical protein K2Q18_18380 [Bdellovibrionales bacterium]|nr:hypothetical protein [Bdellovibrionales bacterium]
MKSLFLISLLALSSCAGMMEDWKRQNCNYNKAYEAGNNTREEGTPMDSSEYNACPDEVRNEVLKGYRDGYERSRQSEVQNNRGVGIKIGSTQINIGNKASAKSYFCTLEAFTSTYEAFGATKLEAQKAVQAKCMQNYDRMHCDEFRCRVNK